LPNTSKIYQLLAASCSCWPHVQSSVFEPSRCPRFAPPSPFPIRHGLVGEIHRKPMAFHRKSRFFFGWSSRFALPMVGWYCQILPVTPKWWAKLWDLWVLLPVEDTKTCNMCFFEMIEDTQEIKISQDYPFRGMPTGYGPKSLTQTSDSFRSWTWPATVSGLSPGWYFSSLSRHTQTVWQLQSMPMISGKDNLGSSIYMGTYQNVS
jgi:hypothetical protein